MRRKRQDAESMGQAGLAVGLVLFGSVLVGLLMWLLSHSGIGNLALVFVVVVAAVAGALAWLWSRLR